MGNVITILEATYISTAEGESPTFVGLWFSEDDKPKLQLFGLDRTDILCLENGDKGVLACSGERWDFIPRGN